MQIFQSEILVDVDMQIEEGNIEYGDFENCNINSNLI